MLSKKYLFGIDYKDLKKKELKPLVQKENTSKQSVISEVLLKSIGILVVVLLLLN